MAPDPTPPLPPPESPERWSVLQQLRRTGADPAPWLAALEAGSQPAAPDLLEVLVGQVDANGARRLLAWNGPVTLTALHQELVVWSEAAAVAWLDPLLDAAAAGGALADNSALLPVLGRCRHPRVALLLRQTIAGAPVSAAAAAAGAGAGAGALLPLLGHQRQPEDLPLLLQWALQPGPIAARRAALEGLALGLAAWPPAALRPGLVALAVDLDPSLASKAVDLLARLPQGAADLRGLRDRAPLDPGVRQRLDRRLAAVSQPLVLVVHGRSGGLIPPDLRALAEELAQCRRAPVQLVALSGGPQEATPALRAAALERGGLGLVPLLLLPGGHVRHDLPPIVARFRQLGPLRRYPFLGAWSRWQQQLAALVDGERREGRSLLWLHHPLEGALPQRYLAHLARRSGTALVATPYTAEQGWSALPAGPGVVWQPLVLAANRLTEGLQHLPARPPLRPPLLHQAPVRQLLLQLLGALP